MAHQIVALATRLVVDEREQRVTLTPAGAAELTAALKALFGKRELADAATDLIELAYYLHTELRVPHVATALLDVVTIAEPQLRAMGESERSVADAIAAGVSSGAAAARQMVGSVESKVPVGAAPAPPGSVKNSPL